MKKILLIVLCALMSLTLFGCQKKSDSPENLDTEKSVDTESIKKNITENYKNELSGLVKYLQDMNYLPLKEEPTTMLAKVIGAKEGLRYSFTVDDRSTLVELYEYDLEKQNKDSERVRTEVLENGFFHVFEDESVDSTEYSASIPCGEKGKYMVMYSGTQERAENIAVLIKDFESAFGSSDSTETSKTDEASKTEEASKTDEASKTEEASKTDETSNAA